MRRNLVLLAGLAALAAHGACAAATIKASRPATAAQSSAGEAMTGYWVGWSDQPPRPDSEVNTPNDRRRYPPELQAVLKPWARAVLERYQEAAAGEHEPPTPDNHCLPFGMPGERASYGFPIEVLIGPKVSAILLQIDHQMRLIHMNAQHPAKVKPSWYGHSIGHWEGDTLVIDTIGFNQRSEFSDGVPHSPKLHAVERYRLFDNGTKLEGQYTYDDPDAFTGPYSFVRKFQRSEPFQEYVTAENNQLYPCPTAEAGTEYKGRE